MTELLLIACCCGGGGGPVPCWKLAVPCHCPDGQTGPNKAVQCDELAQVLGISSSAEVAFNQQDGHGCYHVGISSPQVNPFATDPPLEVVNLLGFMQLYPSCEACCQPVECWQLLAECSCNPGGGSGGVWIDCDLVPGLANAFVKINNKCYRRQGNPVNTLPPGAIVVDHIDENGFADCQDCCDTLPPPVACPTDCSGCPNDLTMTVPPWQTVPDPDCFLSVQAAAIPMPRQGAPTSCIWGSNQPNGGVFIPGQLCCPPDCVDLSVYMEAGVSCSQVSEPPGSPMQPAWIAAFDVNQSGANAQYWKPASPCPMGGYARMSSTPTFYPGSITIA